MPYDSEYSAPIEMSATQEQYPYPGDNQMVFESTRPIVFGSYDELFKPKGANGSRGSESTESGHSIETTIHDNPYVDTRHINFDPPQVTPFEAIRGQREAGIRRFKWLRELADNNVKQIQDYRVWRNAKLRDDRPTSTMPAVLGANDSFQTETGRHRKNKIGGVVAAAGLFALAGATMVTVTWPESNVGQGSPAEAQMPNIPMVPNKPNIPMPTSSRPIATHPSASTHAPSRSNPNVAVSHTPTRTVSSPSALPSMSSLLPSKLPSPSTSEATSVPLPSTPPTSRTSESAPSPSTPPSETKTSEPATPSSAPSTPRPTSTSS